MEKTSATNNNSLLFITIIILFLFTFIFLAVLQVEWNNYRELARSFLQGKLHYNSDEVISTRFLDLSFFKGRFYYPLGILPAIILMPFVKIFGPNFNHNTLIGLLAIINFFLIYKICLRKGMDQNGALWLSVFYIFGSAFYALVLKGTESINFAHLVASTLLFGSLYEYFTKKRWALIGTLVALSALTRPLILFASLFFFILIVLKKENIKTRILNSLKLFYPVSIAIIIMMGYNMARFENPLETGYRYQMNIPEIIENRNQGMFSFKHLPANLYSMLIQTPDPVLQKGSFVLKFPYIKPGNLGMSVIFTSPLLLVLFLANWKKKLNIVCFLISAIIAVFHLLFFGTINSGYQYGYRFIFDYFPFLLLVIIATLKPHLSYAVRFLIILGLVINFWLIFTSSYILIGLTLWA